MKKNYLIIFILLYSLTSEAQTYNPLIRNNIYWDVMGIDLSTFCGYNRGGRYSFQNDTVIAGNTYKTIRKNPIVSQYTGLPAFAYCPPYAVYASYSYGPFDGYYSVLLREDSIARKVYVYNTASSSDELFYDFNLVAGDTLKSPYASYGYTLIVDSVSTVTLLNSAVRKIIYLDNGSNYIESIGGSQGLQFMLYNPGSGFGYGSDPTCFVENGVHLWGSQCIGTVGIDENGNNESISVFPNPAENFIILNSKEYLNSVFKIIDVTGRMVLIADVNQENEKINISSLSLGCYTYSFENRKGNKIGKLIVTR